MATEEIITFEDLMALLERNPEYRERLRQQILGEEFESLPAQVRTLLEAVQSQAVTLEKHSRLLEEHGRRLEEHTRLLEGHTRLLEEHTDWLQGIDRRLDRHERQLNRLLGDEAERRFRDNAAGHFGHLLRRIRVIDKSALADQIDDAIDAGLLTESDRRALMALDVVVRGLDRNTREECRLAVEVSSGIGERDIMRAADRAELLAKLTGLPTRAVVAGYSISNAYRQLADDNGVSVTITDAPDAGEPEDDVGMSTANGSASPT